MVFSGQIQTIWSKQKLQSNYVVSWLNKSLYVLNIQRILDSNHVMKTLMALGKELQMWSDHIWFSLNYSMLGDAQDEHSWLLYTDAHILQLKWVDILKPSKHLTLRLSCHCCCISRFHRTGTLIQPLAKAMAKITNGVDMPKIMMYGRGVFMGFSPSLSPAVCQYLHSSIAPLMSVL